MRIIDTALWPLEEHPEAGLSLGVILDEEGAPNLVGLVEGERVLLREPNELQAEATVHVLDLNGRRFWFGEIGSSEAIQNIYTDPAATHP